MHAASGDEGATLLMGNPKLRIRFLGVGGTLCLLLLTYLLIRILCLLLLTYLLESVDTLRTGAQRKGGLAQVPSALALLQVLSISPVLRKFPRFALDSSK